MAKKKSKSMKIDGMQVEEPKKTVSFTVAFIIALICFTAGIMAYKYIFMVLPTKPGCVRISVKNTENTVVPKAKVQIYGTVLIDEMGEKIIEDYTDTKGKIKFCNIFAPNTDYGVMIYDQDGKLIWLGYFSTNARGTAEFPVIVMEESE